MAKARKKKKRKRKKKMKRKQLTWYRCRPNQAMDEATLAHPHCPVRLILPFGNDARVLPRQARPFNFLIKIEIRSKKNASIHGIRGVVIIFADVDRLTTPAEESLWRDPPFFFIVIGLTVGFLFIPFLILSFVS